MFARIAKYLSPSIILFTGCIAASETSDPEQPDPSTAASTDLVRTRVYLQVGGGKPVVQTERISREVFDAEVAARQAMRAGVDVVDRMPLVGVDTGCAGSSMWMFDNLNNQPGQFFFNRNEICFFSSGGGCADLRNYWRYALINPDGTLYQAVTWATNDQSAIASFWSGDTPGSFWGVKNLSLVFTNFYTYDREDDAQNTNLHGQDPSGVAYARYLCF